MSFFGRKSACKLCKSVRKHLDVLHSASKSLAVATTATVTARTRTQSNSNADTNKDKDNRDFAEEVNTSMGKLVQYLHEMKVMVLGDPDASSCVVDESESCKLTDELLASTSTCTLLQEIIELAVVGTLPFESRKEASAVATYILHHKTEKSASFLENHRELIAFLLSHYDSATRPDVALECGALLREAIHHGPIADAMLNDPGTIQTLFTLVQHPQFDISSDAWETLKLLFAEHRANVGAYLESHFDVFLSSYSVLLDSENFFTKRQSLQLLSSLLVCRTNYNFLIKFTASSAALKIIMNLCRAEFLCVQLEAFSVLKLFAVNPNKSQAVVEILSRNRVCLVSFLKQVAEEEEKDGSYHDEAYILISELDKLPPYVPHTANHGQVQAQAHDSSSSSSLGDVDELKLIASSSS